MCVCVCVCGGGGGGGVRGGGGLIALSFESYHLKSFVSI